MIKTPDNAEYTYKCSQCGMMFSNKRLLNKITKKEKVECPFCHNYCDSKECEIVGSSNEGY